VFALSQFKTDRKIEQAVLQSSRNRS
jgi:hypothetical protein